MSINNKNSAFDEWWLREGRSFDPDTLDVPWEDKRRFLAEKAFDVATAQGRNYITDKEVNPSIVTFSNGRVVRHSSNGLIVEPLRSFQKSS